MKPSSLKKVNIITVLAKCPHGENTRKEVLVFYVGGKPQKIISGKKINEVGFAPGVLEVEGKERYHYVNQPPTT